MPETARKWSRTNGSKRVWPVAALKVAHQSPVAAELVARKSKKVAHEMVTVNRLGLPAKLRSLAGTNNSSLMPPGMGVATVRLFEAGKGEQRRSTTVIRQALEAAGVEFTNGDRPM